MATPMANLPIELQKDQTRRSSSRSIKRKRFDDEIVEYSIGFPQSRSEQSSRLGRPRSSVSVPQSSYATPPPPPPQTSSTPLAQPTSISSPTSSAGSKVMTVTTDTSPSTLISTVSSISGTPQGKSPPTSNQSSTVQSPLLAHTRAPAPPSVERRRAAARPNRRTRKTGRPPAQVATKDLGRWKPIDDLALIFGVQQTNDLRMVHRGVKFSCKFTMQELQARWISLLYEPAISRTALTAMRNLHPELVESIYRRALFSTEEEEQLATIKSTENPKLERFQELLDKNAFIFLGTRTAKILQKHWQLMKQYQLLPDQNVKSVKSDDRPMSFSDAEDLIVDSELNDQRDEALEIELELSDRKQKREIRLLENELNRWNVLVDSITGAGIAPEFDGQTLAVLRGRLVRYLMRSKEITFGRDAKDCVVDVDLSLEGPACKISRRQGTIKLRSNGDFFIANEGKRPLFIDGVPLLAGNKARLANNCVVEICGLRFVFLVNYELINAIRHESAKTTTPLN